jgi:cytochrome c2
MNPADRPRFHADFSRAPAFATALHAAQVRKQTDIPYISHLIAVAGLVLEHGGSGDEAIAGLLHDDAMGLRVDARRNPRCVVAPANRSSQVAMHAIPGGAPGSKMDKRFQLASRGYASGYDAVHEDGERQDRIHPRLDGGRIGADGHVRRTRTGAARGLVNANYRQGMVAFQSRCSACHSLAEGGTNLAGPNLFGVFARNAGGKSDFRYSAALGSAGFQWTPARLLAWIADPQGYLRGSTMMLPEPVPEADRVALLSFLMLETGAADWPKPRPPRAAGTTAAANAPLAERFPSFWNHLMTNTTRYRVE